MLAMSTGCQNQRTMIDSSVAVVRFVALTAKGGQSLRMHP